MIVDGDEMPLVVEASRDMLKTGRPKVVVARDAAGNAASAAVTSALPLRLAALLWSNERSHDG
jgi:hypothetical protein